MNIIVAMKQVPDLGQIRIRNRQPVLEGVPYALGLIDKNALEAGMQLKEAHEENKLIALSVGNKEIEETIKEALAAGADEACLLADDHLENLDSAQSAHLIAVLIKQIEDIGLIIFGEGSADNYSSQVGSRVAEILGLPQVGYASQIQINGNTAIITRSLEDQEEEIEMPLPGVVTVLGDINEPRLPSVTQVLKAGKKPKQIYDLSDLEQEIPDRTITTNSNLAPENQRKQIQIKEITQLIEALQTEGFIRR